MYAEPQELFETLITPERHARKPRFTHELGDYQYIRSYAHASKFAYIQAQSPSRAFRLVFDIDRDVAALSRAHEWPVALNAPEPNYVLLNPENGHAHLFYELETGVALYDGARIKPLEYLAAVQDGLTRRLGADDGYAGFLCKNARWKDWEFVAGRREPYTLGELYEYGEEPPESERKKKRVDVTGLKRNCTLFTQLRYWAYGALSSYSERAAWDAAVLAHASQLNVFQPALYPAEVRAIARSVGKWVWTKLGQKPELREAFIERQRFKQAKQAAKKRAVTTADVVTAQAKLRAQGKRVSMRAVAKIIGCHASNLSQHYKNLF